MLSAAVAAAAARISDEFLIYVLRIHEENVTRLAMDFLGIWSKISLAKNKTGREIVCRKNR